MLQTEIGLESDRTAGGAVSLAGKAPEYQRLVLEKEFSDKMLTSAMSTLEQAKNEAQRKQLYLEKIVLPNLPDDSLEPRRLRAIIATLIVGLMIYAIGTLLLTGMREHFD